MKPFPTAAVAALLLLAVGCGGVEIPEPSPTAPLSTAPPAPTPTPSTAPTPAPARSTVFRAASFNILGASHTVSGCAGKPFCSPGRQRVRLAVQVLRKHRVDVVGLQEFEPPQLAPFLAASGPDWAVWPGMRYGGKSLANSIAWNTKVWTLTYSEMFKIPYFEGRLRTQPAILLRNRATGRTVAFLNVHNPAEVAWSTGNGPSRAQALQIEVAQIARFRKANYPVVLTGDFNGRRKVFCTLTRQAGVHSASGGVTSPSCRPSAISNVDWIFGTRDVLFSDFVRDKSALVQRAADHPIVVSTVTVPQR